MHLPAFWCNGKSPFCIVKFRGRIWDLDEALQVKEITESCSSQVKRWPPEALLWLQDVSAEKLSCVLSRHMIWFWSLIHWTFMHIITSEHVNFETLYQKLFFTGSFLPNCSGIVVIVFIVDVAFSSCLFGLGYRLCPARRPCRTQLLHLSSGCNI
jgi:hypothetical protein